MRTAAGIPAAVFGEVLFFDKEIGGSGFPVKGNLVCGIAQIIGADLQLILTERNGGGFAGADGERSAESIQVVGGVISLIAELLVCITPQQIISDFRGDFITGYGDAYYGNLVGCVGQRIVLTTRNQGDHVTFSCGKGGNLGVGAGDFFGVAVSTIVTSINHGSVGFGGRIVVAGSGDDLAVGITTGAGVNGGTVFGAGGGSSGCFVAVRTDSFDGDLHILVNSAFTPAVGNLDIAAAFCTAESDDTLAGDVGDDTLGIVLYLKAVAAAGGKFSCRTVCQQSKLQLCSITVEEVVQIRCLHGVGYNSGSGNLNGFFLED